jgi:hypothetical protein
MSGNDILDSDRVLSDRIIQPKKNYMRMMWFAAKPSSNSPFHLSAIIQPADPNASSWSETREVVLSLEERIRTLESAMRDVQETIKLIVEEAARR